ncbi:MAG: hypothetical protein WCK70_03340 [Chloroflexales bacterium]
MGHLLFLLSRLNAAHLLLYLMIALVSASGQLPLLNIFDHAILVHFTFPSHDVGGGFAASPFVQVVAP